MVEPTFLVALAVAFALGLILIWRQNTPTHVVEKKRPQNEKKIKAQKKQKGPQRNSLKKDKRPQDVKEWTGVDTAQKDAQEMLEFLKGKDPNEIAKQLGQGKKKKVQAAAAAKKAKAAEESASEDSASESDGFKKIVKKAKKEKEEKKEEKKKKEERKKGGEDKGAKSFFKVEGEKSEEKKPKRKPAAEGELGERKRKERPEGERRERPEGERKERPEGEKRERRERPEGERPADGERKERPDRPVRKPIPTVAPIVKYEQADLTDILDSITQDFDSKPKPKTNRVSSDFSKIPRTIVVSILAKVEARDLVALSRVNHHFSGLARKESLWKDLLQRDFGLKDMGKHRTFRIAYKAEFKRRKAAKKQQRKEEKAVVEAPPAAETEETKDEQPEKETKQPKQKKDNKKKKADEQPADGPAED